MSKLKNACIEAAGKSSEDKLTLLPFIGIATRDNQIFAARLNMRAVATSSASRCRATHLKMPPQRQHRVFFTVAAMAAPMMMSVAPA